MLNTISPLLRIFKKQKEGTPFIKIKAVNPAVYPFLCQYEKLSILCDFHEIPYRNSLQTVVKQAIKLSTPQIGLVKCHTLLKIINKFRAVFSVFIVLS